MGRIQLRGTVPLSRLHPRRSRQEPGASSTVLRVRGSRHSARSEATPASCDVPSTTGGPSIVRSLLVLGGHRPPPSRATPLSRSPCRPSAFAHLGVPYEAGERRLSPVSATAMLRDQGPETAHSSSMLSVTAKARTAAIAGVSALLAFANAASGTSVAPGAEGHATGSSRPRDQ